MPLASVNAPVFPAIDETEPADASEATVAFFQAPPAAGRKSSHSRQRRGWPLSSTRPYQPWSGPRCRLCCCQRTYKRPEQPDQPGAAPSDLLPCLTLACRAHRRQNRPRPFQLHRSVPRANWRLMAWQECRDVGAKVGRVDNRTARAECNRAAIGAGQGQGAGSCQRLSGGKRKHARSGGPGVAVIGFVRQGFRAGARGKCASRRQGYVGRSGCR